MYVLFSGETIEIVGGMVPYPNGVYRSTAPTGVPANSPVKIKPPIAYKTSSTTATPKLSLAVGISVQVLQASLSGS